MKKSWYYWMYQHALKTGFGSFVPDFPPLRPLQKKEFDDSMLGQTIHQLTKVELKHLQALAHKN